jgi:hypothetical protein
MLFGLASEGHDRCYKEQDMAFPTSLNVLPTTPTEAHRTITALDGEIPPLPAHADFEASPVLFGDVEEDHIVRFYVDLVVRGTTGLANDPEIVFRPYVRNGGASGVVAACQSVSFIRPRLQDLSTIKFQKTVNNGVAYTDYSANVIDNNPATQADLDALDTVANGDWFVIGGPVPFIGAALDMDAANVNANNAVLTVEYWTGAAWAAMAAMTDGTIVAAGKTLSGDGQVTWRLPTDWASSTINAITAYWVRCSVNAALSAAVDVEECDLLLPMKPGIDVQVDQDDTLLFLESQEAIVTGTLVYEGSIRTSWR